MNRTLELEEQEQMAFLISFPDKGVKVQTFKRVIDALPIAEASERCPRFILATLSPKALRVLTLPLLHLILLSNSSSNKETLPSTKDEAIERAIPLIKSLAQPGPGQTEVQPEEIKMAAAKKGAKKAKKGVKKAAPKTEGKKGPGRVSDFAGKKLTKGDTFKGREGSRRTSSYNAIKSGSKYESCLESGAHKDDIAILVRDGHLLVSD